ncbi:hypothetical protein L210DRAFT_2085537 [Boletus edulis BED1]|uniref:Uncharacterized protein n=1 Tax=Boletus edulis BED1 TaxID=1328754 RepID=A0AAD4GGT1_BOLED|nr:hypothetical protein L210DRAFT_2085537 [Boletus edulis BED1]
MTSRRKTHVMSKIQDILNRIFFSTTSDLLPRELEPFGPLQTHLPRRRPLFIILNLHPLLGDCIPAFSGHEDDDSLSGMSSRKATGSHSRELSNKRVRQRTGRCTQSNRIPYKRCLPSPGPLSTMQLVRRCCLPMLWQQPQLKSVDVPRTPDAKEDSSSGVASHFVAAPNLCPVTRLLIWSLMQRWRPGVLRRHRYRGISVVQPSSRESSSLVVRLSSQKREWLSLVMGKEAMKPNFKYISRRL